MRQLFRQVEQQEERESYGVTYQTEKITKEHFDAPSFLLFDSAEKSMWFISPYSVFVEFWPIIPACLDIYVGIFIYGKRSER